MAATDAAPDAYAIAGAFAVLTLRGSTRICMQRAVGGSPNSFVLKSAQSPVKVTKKGNTLEVASKGGGVSLGSGCGVVSFGGGCTISGGCISLASGADPEIYVGGRKMRLVPEDDASLAPKPEDPAYSKTWTITNSRKIEQINLSGSGDLRIEYGRALGSEVEVSVAGSGDVYCPDQSFDRFTVTIAGAGDVKFDRTTIRRLSISISGAGDVSGFHAVEHVNVSIAGAGDVFGTAARDCEVSKNTMGVGTVNIKKERR